MLMDRFRFDSWAFNVIEIVRVPKISPIIAVRRRDLFESADWVYELNHDGSAWHRDRPALGSHRA